MIVTLKSDPGSSEVSVWIDGEVEITGPPSRVTQWLEDRKVPLGIADHRVTLAQDIGLTIFEADLSPYPYSLSDRP